MMVESPGVIPIDIKYSILDPTGNITALVESRVDMRKQPELAAAIMRRHPEVEQVGFVSFGDSEETVSGGDVPRGNVAKNVVSEGTVSEGNRIDVELRMAGGEFCGNASLCAATLFLIRKHRSNVDGESKMSDFQLEQDKPVTVRLRVSGASQEIEVCLTKEADNRFDGGIHMPPPCRIEEKKMLFNNITETIPVVSMEGISHIIIGPDSEFSGLQKEPETAARAVREWCESLSADGLGLMFLERQESEIFLTPLVYVPGSGTVYWENSCASGTSAAAMYLAKIEGRPLSLSFHEPGGRLKVCSEPAGKNTWLYGKIRLVSTYS